MGEADGFVTECLYNQFDGCYWAKRIIVDMDALNKINAGDGASNAYKPLQMAEGGIYYNTTNKHFYGYNGTTWKQLDN